MAKRELHQHVRAIGLVVVASILGAACPAVAAGETRQAPALDGLPRAVAEATNSTGWTARHIAALSEVSAAVAGAMAVQRIRLAQAEAARQAEEARRRAEAVREAEIARQAEASRPRFVWPAQGVLTSGFGARWGTTHYGIDIANRIGTPIKAAADGVVIEAGPASGFGLWVRVLHDDGTVTVYGHVDRILRARGQRVRANDVIATMGNRGQSTGPHLHFEVWLGGQRKINPMPWLADHGAKNS